MQQYYFIETNTRFATVYGTDSFEFIGIRAGGLFQVVECLPSKNKALSSNPSSAKKKEKELVGVLILLSGKISLPSFSPKLI
jgi:hypothetical protein